jgi:hypothetical protein
VSIPRVGTACGAKARTYISADRIKAVADTLSKPQRSTSLMVVSQHLAKHFYPTLLEHGVPQLVSRSSVVGLLAWGSSKIHEGMISRVSQ